MGQAKRRGNFEQRKAEAIAAGKMKTKPEKDSSAVVDLNDAYDERHTIRDLVQPGLRRSMAPLAMLAMAMMEGPRRKK